MNDPQKSADTYYQHDLAYVHDQSYSEISIHAAKLLLKRLAQAGFSSGTIVDLGCGSGKLLQVVSSQGFDTVGVDISPDLIEIAKRNSPDSTFHLGSIWDYDIPHCVAVTAIGEIITYRFDDRNTNENLSILFSRIYDKLVENGIFIFDFLTPGILGDRDSDCRIVRHNEWIMGVEYHEDKSDHTLIRDITLFRKIGDGLYRQSQEIHRVKLIEPEYIVKSLKSIGFRVEMVDNYDGRALRDKHIAMIAHKTSTSIT